MATSIASAGLAMHTSRIMTDVNMALMGEALDSAEAQKEAMQKTVKLSSPSFHVSDVYAWGTALQTGRRFLSNKDG